MAAVDSFSAVQIGRDGQGVISLSSGLSPDVPLTEWGSRKTAGNRKGAINGKGGDDDGIMVGEGATAMWRLLIGSPASPLSPPARFYAARIGISSVPKAAEPDSLKATRSESLRDSSSISSPETGRGAESKLRENDASVLTTSAALSLFQQTYLQQPGPSVSSANSEALALSGKVPSWILEQAGGKAGLGTMKGRLRAVLKDFSLRGQLNLSQMGAIEGAMFRRVSLWQGPPGTGKTRTLLHLISCVISTVESARETEKAKREKGGGKKAISKESRAGKGRATSGDRGRVCRGRILAVADR